MASQVNDATKLALNCCIADTVDDVNIKSMQGSLTKACLYESAMMVFQNEIVQTYVPNGTVLEEGFTSDATLDLSAFAAFGDLTGAVIINSILVGTLPEENYPDIDSLIDALVQAIADGGSGYTAQNNGDGTITVFAPGPGSAANGFAITIVINPDYALDTTISFETGSGMRQFTKVDNPASPLHGYFITAVTFPALGRQYLYFVYNKMFITRIQTFPLSDGILSGSYAVVYNPGFDRIYSSSNLNPNLGIIDNSLSPIGMINAGVGSIFGVFNAFNDCMYFGNAAGNVIYKVAADFTKTDIVCDVFDSIQSTVMAVDNSSTATEGYVWVIDTNRINRIHPTTNAITQINTPGEQAYSISFYPGDGTPGSEAMFVGYQNPTVVRQYNLDGTVAAATFYAFGEPVRGVLYSTQFDLIFACGATIFRAIKMDGTLKQNITSTNSLTNILEDADNGYIVTSGTNGTQGLVQYWAVTDNGTEEFTGALENGTDDVLMTEDDQCTSESLMNSLVQHLTSECGCTDCSGGGSIAQTVIIPPVTLSYPVYYGNSPETVLTAVQIEALGSVSATTYAGTYSFIAEVGTYKYFAYPSAFGTPSRFRDLIGGLDVVMDAPYSVVINFIDYTVYRTFNIMGGAQQWEVEQ